MLNWHIVDLVCSCKATFNIFAAANALGDLDKHQDERIYEEDRTGRELEEKLISSVLCRREYFVWHHRCDLVLEDLLIGVNPCTHADVQKR